MEEELHRAIREVLTSQKVLMPRTERWEVSRRKSVRKRHSMQRGASYEGPGMGKSLVCLRNWYIACVARIQRLNTRMAETRGEREVSTITGALRPGSLDFILSSKSFQQISVFLRSLCENGHTVMRVRWC